VILFDTLETSAMASVIRDIDALRSHARVRPYDPSDYVFFYGHRPARAGRVDISCLSQWYPASFVVMGEVFLTAEHYMMAGKAELFGDDEVLQQILDAGSPGEAKALGRQVRGFDETVWRAHRFDIVVRGNLAKFRQNHALGEFLRRTGKRVLVEASRSDRIWGIGLDKRSAMRRRPETWPGLNVLGFALMETRDVLLAEAVM